MKDNKLNIFFVLDKNYIVPFTVTLTSILENNQDLAFNVFVIHELEQNQELDTAYEFFQQKYQLTLNLKKIKANEFDKFYLSKYITKAAYYKLLLPSILPSEVEKGLYIDCDTVVIGSLKELNAISFFELGYEVGLLAVEDIRKEREIKRMRSMGEATKSYFNSGVMFVNLKKWREDEADKKMIEIGEKYGNQLTYHDQDILNIFFENNHANLDPRYNRDASIKHNTPPIILHYLGTSKPWHFVDNSPYKHIYRKYLKITPFKNVRTEGISLENFARKYVRLARKKFSSGPNYNN